MAATVQVPQAERRHLGDDLLLEIFIRVGRDDDLIRTSAACVAFRRLITGDPTFLPRHRSHHKPLLLGVLNSEGSKFHPVEAPRPNTAAARAAANIVSFRDHLPIPKNETIYCPCDIHDGRILLPSGASYPNLDYGVYDPLSRQYLKLPRVPNFREEARSRQSGEVFAPACAGDDDPSSFKVLTFLHYKTELLVAMFDSRSGIWSPCASSNLFNPEKVVTYNAGRAYNSYYWKVVGKAYLLKFDMNRTTELSVLGIPSLVSRYEMFDNGTEIVVVEAENGRLGMFCYNPHDKYIEYYILDMQISEDRGAMWQMESCITVPTHRRLSMAGGPRGYVYIQLDGEGLEGYDEVDYYDDNDDEEEGSEEGASLDDDGDDSLRYTAGFLLDVHTLNLDRVTQMSSAYFPGRPYFCSRTSMSPRRI